MSGSRIVLAVALWVSAMAMLALAPTVQTASAHGGDEIVGFGRATAGVLFGGDDLGFHGDILISGPSEFSFGVDSTFLSQQRDTGSETFHNTRIYIAFGLVEFPAGGYLGLQLGLHIGDRLVGDDGFTEFGTGVEVYQPLFLDDEGHPFWSVMVAWQFAPFDRIDEDFQLKFVTMINPLPEPIRELGLWVGWFVGESGNTPFQAVYIGIGWTPHIHGG